MDAITEAIEILSRMVTDMEGDEQNIDTAATLIDVIELLEDEATK